MKTQARIDMVQLLSILRAIAGGSSTFAPSSARFRPEIRSLLAHDHLDVALLSGDRTLVVAYETGLHTEWDADTTATKPVESSPIRDLFRGARRPYRDRRRADRQPLSL